MEERTMTVEQLVFQLSECQATIKSLTSERDQALTELQHFFRNQYSEAVSEAQSLRTQLDHALEERDHLRTKVERSSEQSVKQAVYLEHVQAVAHSLLDQLFEWGRK
jgi:uncharacterized coiled-coil DUF342 family protein